MSNTTLKNTFVSCIKVRGINLLPPVITDSRRLELQKDKQQALKLEKRLQNCKNLKKNLEELLTLHTLTDSPNFTGNSHIDDLGISSARSSVQPKKLPNLSQDILDVTEYNNDGIKIINKDNDMVIESGQGQIEFKQGRQLSANSCCSDAYDTDSSLNKSSEITIPSVYSSIKNHVLHSSSIDLGKNKSENSSSLRSPRSEQKSSRSATKSNTRSPTSPKARLIRSNSYTLEAPSPILLAHLEKFNKTNSPHTLQQNSSLSRTWTSLENNFIPLEDSDFSSIKTVFSRDLDRNDETIEMRMDNSYNEEMAPQKDVGRKSPTIEVVHTDISVQQITVNANSDEIVPVKGTFNLSDPDSQLMQVLKKIPEDYSKQIIELIEKQRAEHYAKVENFGKQFNPKNNQSTPQKGDSVSSDQFNDVLLDTMTKSSSPKPTESENSTSFEEIHKNQKNETFSLNKPSHDIESISRTNTKEFSDEDNFETTFQKQHDSFVDSFRHTDVQKLIKNFCSSEETNPKKVGPGRQVFGSNYSSSEDAKREWAANLICAHVKGYLTRRLLKTSRVQSLIDTIRDALLCALELHTVEQIDEADIELHRRLINQVSAACFAFHDIFFALSIPEKMAIISADRKRIIEKTRRPSSAPNINRSISNSSRSSTKSFHSHSQSLMKI